MLEKLYRIQNFDRYLFPNGVEHLGKQADGSFISVDPVQLLWDCFRLGAPIAHLYNQLRPQQPLEVPDVSSFVPGKDTYKSSMKKPVMQFLMNYKNELFGADVENVIVSDLYSEDSNSFMKFLNLVERLIDRIEEKGYLPPPRPLPINFPSQQETVPTDIRSMRLAELLDTERLYLHDLEKLHTFQKAIVEQNILGKEKVYTLFANLGVILDFQRRFLIQMETTLSFSVDEQRLGYLFLTMEDQFCSVYEPYCGNYEFAVKCAAEEKNSLMDVIKMTNPDFPHYKELQEGLESAKRIADTVNEQKRKEENRKQKIDLVERMEEWKELNPDDLGELLLWDKFPMSSGDQEREYLIFLFSGLLLCCKDLGRRSKNRQSRKDRNFVNEVSNYALRGNISIHLISRVIDTSNEDLTNCGICVYWKDQNSIETFTLKCRNHEQVRLWKSRMERLMEDERRKRKSVAEAQFDVMNKYNYSWTVNDDNYDSQRESMYPPQQEEQKAKVQRSKSIPVVYYPPAQNSNNNSVNSAGPKKQLTRNKTYSPTSAQDTQRGRQPDRQINSVRGSSAGSALVKNNSESYSPYVTHPRGRTNSPPPSMSFDQYPTPPQRYAPPPPGMPPSGPLPLTPQQAQSNMYSNKGNYPPSPTAVTSGYNRRPVPTPPAGPYNMNTQTSYPSPQPGYNSPQRYNAPENSSPSPIQSGFPNYSNQNYSNVRPDLNRSKSYTQSDDNISRPPRGIPRNLPQTEKQNSLSSVYSSSTLVPSPTSNLASSYFSPPPNLPLPPIPNIPLPPAPKGFSSVTSSPTSYEPPNYSKDFRRKSSASSFHSTHSGNYNERSSSPPPPVPTIPSNFPTNVTNKPPAPTKSTTVSRLEGLESSLEQFANDPDFVSSEAPPPANFYQQNNYFGNSNGSNATLTNNNSNGITHRSNSTRSATSQSFIKVRTHYGRETLVIAVQNGCLFHELYTRIEEKIRMYGGNSFLTEDETGKPRRFKMTYKDDEGDYNRIETDKDVDAAFEVAKLSVVEKGVLNVFVD
ncbi:hypothetical protein HK098_005602 [Nowakowskiella sp. JEL0407]|nr:hypothetical protein HK098_005602 [Nowakowskiella sp. JEL0407]